MSDAQAPSRVPGAESSLEQMMRDANRAIHFANDGRPAAVSAHWQPGSQSVVRLAVAPLCHIQALSCLVNANVRMWSSVRPPVRGPLVAGKVQNPRNRTVKLSSVEIPSKEWVKQGCELQPVTDVQGGKGEPGPK